MKINVSKSTNFWQEIFPDSHSAHFGLLKELLAKMAFFPHVKFYQSVLRTTFLLDDQKQLISCLLMKKNGAVGHQLTTPPSAHFSLPQHHPNTCIEIKNLWMEWELRLNGVGLEQNWRSWMCSKRRCMYCLFSKLERRGQSTSVVTFRRQPQMMIGRGLARYRNNIDVF